jgi:hypothetical protein
MLRLAADVSAIRALGDLFLPRGLERCLGRLQTLSPLCDPRAAGELNQPPTSVSRPPAALDLRR